MTRVDFYLISADSERACASLACKLAEKAYRLKHRVHLHMADRDRAERMNEFLWTYREGSFVPHALNTQSPLLEPVSIGSELNVPEQADLFINLSQELPPFPERFERLAEIVDANPARKRESRERYKQYRAQGYELATHEIS